MKDDEINNDFPAVVRHPPDGVICAELAPEPRWVPAPPMRPRRRRVWLPLLLFVATCLSTWLVGLRFPTDFAERVNAEGLSPGVLYVLAEAAKVGLWFAVPLMTILVCHEMGHFIQAYRYGVYASYPYFIPMPISPLGTMGAVIGMESHMGHRRALFDIGITGPLAGLVPTLIFLYVGLQWSVTAPIVPGDKFGEPLLFQLFSWLTFGPIPATYEIHPHPMAFAGWAGLLLTSLNLMPIGQLDGGHVLYSLIGRWAHVIARILLASFLMIVVVFGLLGNRDLLGWTLMLILLIMMGPAHPPTADDYEPLGLGRTILGWLTLAFIIIGFTPTPFLIGR